MTWRGMCRFFVKDVRVLEEATTQRVFFQQARALVSRRQLPCAKDDVITLAALALQATQGDFLSESTTRHHVDSLGLIPDTVILESSSSLENVATMVSQQYKSMAGQCSVCACVFASRPDVFASHSFMQAWASKRLFLHT